jgi:hypothetical protein
VSKKTDSQKVKILLVSQIVAQGTKIKAWEIVVTKVGILSFVMQKHRTLVFGINLISILQSSHLSESVFLKVTCGAADTVP